MDKVDVNVEDEVVEIVEKDNNVVEIYAGDEMEPWTTVILTDAEMDTLKATAEEQEVSLEELMVSLLEDAVKETKEKEAAELTTTE